MCATLAPWWRRRWARPPWAAWATRPSPPLWPSWLSGGDFLEQARQLGAQCLVTADVKHDQFLQAAHMGMGLVDAGHFSTEQVVCAPLARWIQELVPQTWVARCSGEPFHWAK